MTNEDCNFWHFRFADNARQLSYVIARSLPLDVKKVYLLNQDYLWGHSVSRDVKESLAKLRPDVQIVGDEYIPLGMVKDFSPYIAKIKASAAQSVITGNYGPDLNLVIRAGADAGLHARFDTYLAWFPGAVTAIGESGVGTMTVPIQGHPPDWFGSHDAEEFFSRFHAGHNFYCCFPSWMAGFAMLSRARNETGSMDPAKVAAKLEGMQWTDLNGDVETMRAEDHQLIQPLYSAVLSKDVKYDVEGTGLGWKTVGKVAADELAAMPTACQMKRPAG